jgi:hypothetical protein
MSDPISRLELAKSELVGFAERHPEVLIAVVNAASGDFLALTLARAIGNAAERVAEALLKPEEELRDLADDFDAGFGDKLAAQIPAA